MSKWPWLFMDAPHSSLASHTVSQIPALNVMFEVLLALVLFARDMFGAAVGAAVGGYSPTSSYGFCQPVRSQ